MISYDSAGVLLAFNLKGNIIVVKLAENQILVAHDQPRRGDTMSNPWRSEAEPGAYTPHKIGSLGEATPEAAPNKPTDQNRHKIMRRRRIKGHPQTKCLGEGQQDMLTGCGKVLSGNGERAEARRGHAD